MQTFILTNNALLRI